MLEEGRKQISVGEYVDLVNNTLAMIPSDGIVVVGEIVDYRVSQGKWINFDLKDEQREAKISCFATVFKVKAPLDSGMKVQILGYPKVYERFGKFSLNVEAVELVGEGALAKAYELLKKKLEKEGLFDAARKRTLPRFVEKIGLITSREAAAYGDFLRILNNRWGGVDVVHTPVHVQGQHAVREILEAFAQFEALPEDERPDVLVLTRGGGSLEDLHAFNDEQVARAVFQSSIPVVVGVGHERDESLCDFVADVRASTPSNAAEMVVPDRQEVMREIEMTVRQMGSVINRQLERAQEQVRRSVSTLQHFIDRGVQEIQSRIDRLGFAFDRFRLSLVATRQHIERNEVVLRQTFLHALDRKKEQMRSLVRLFETFDVQHVLKRGFSITRQNGKVVKDENQLATGVPIQIQLSRGTVDVYSEKPPKQETLL